MYYNEEAVNVLFFCCRKEVPVNNQHIVEKMSLAVRLARKVLKGEILRPDFLPEASHDGLSAIAILAAKIFDSLEDEEKGASNA